MRYLSLFSGIEAATIAWHPLGWECVAVSEIEPFPCAVLAHHYPGVPNLGDVTKITEADIAALGPIDIVVFGSPCQDLSTAGHRKGLLDEHGDATRSGLFFTAINIVHWAREHCGCRFALWENVPGAFSSNKGRDFASVVEWMAGLDEVPVPPNGWGTEGVCLGDNGLLEWCVLDAQWFGVAQRRRRVFALLDTGDWVSRPPVLLEPQGLRGNSAPSREAGENTPYPPATSLVFGGNDTRGPIPVRPALNANQGCHNPGDFEAGALCVTGNVTHALTAFAVRTAQTSSNGHGVAEDVAYTIDQAQGQAIANAMQVRRLTPVECERLQGFPDNYTAIPWRGKPADQCPDGPRYKALGNSMAVPVMHWIGSWINLYARF